MEKIVYNFVKHRILFANPVLKYSSGVFANGIHCIKATLSKYTTLYEFITFDINGKGMLLVFDDF